MTEKARITRSSGLSAGLGPWMVGGGYSGATEKLDKTVQKAAEMLSKEFGRDVEIRFNSDRRSGGAWLKDDIKGFEGNVQVGLNASILSKVPKGMSRSEWHRKIAGKVGWGDAMFREIDKAPKEVGIMTYIGGTVAEDPSVVNEGATESRYASHEHGSLKEGLSFLIDNVDRSKVNLYKGERLKARARLGKGSVSELQAIEDSRSERSRESDERQEHSVILDPDDPKVEQWKRDQGRADVRGIDTPRKSRSKKGKRSRGHTSTTLRSIRGR